MKNKPFQHFGFSFNREKRELYRGEQLPQQPEETPQSAEVQQQSVEGHIDSSTQRAGRALAPLERSGMSLDQGTCENVCRDLATFYAQNRNSIRIGSRISTQKKPYNLGDRRDAYTNGRRFEEVYLGSLYVDGDMKGLWMDAEKAPATLRFKQESLRSKREQREEGAKQTRKEMEEYQREFKAKRKAEAMENAASLNRMYDGLHGHGNAYKNGNRHFPRFVNPRTNANQTVVWRPGIGAEAQQVESTGRGSTFNGPDNRTAQQIVSDIDNQYEEKWAREDAQRAEEKMNAENDRIYEWAVREGDWLLEKLGYLQNLNEFDQSIVLPASTKGRGMLAISNVQNRAVATVFPTAENGERVYKIRPNNGPEETIVIHDKGIALKQLMSRLSQLSKPDLVRSMPTPRPESVEPAPVVTQKPKPVEKSVLVNKKEKAFPSKEVPVSDTESTYLNTDTIMQAGLVLYEDLGSVLKLAGKIVKENEGKSSKEMEDQFMKEVGPVLQNTLRVGNISQEELGLLAYFYITRVQFQKNASSLTKEQYTQMLADFLDEYKTTGSNYIDPLLKTRDAAKTVRGTLKRWSSLMWKGIKGQKKTESVKETENNEAKTKEMQEFFGTGTKFENGIVTLPTTGSLKFEGKWPEGITEIRGNISFDDMAYEGLPSSLKVIDGDLRVNYVGIPSIFPEGLRIKGSLVIGENRAITEPDESLVGVTFREMRARNVKVDKNIIVTGDTRQNLVPQYHREKFKEYNILQKEELDAGKLTKLDRFGNVVELKAPAPETNKEAPSEKPVFTKEFIGLANETNVAFKKFLDAESAYKKDGTKENLQLATDSYEEFLGLVEKHTSDIEELEEKYGKENEEIRGYRNQLSTIFIQAKELHSGLNKE